MIRGRVQNGVVVLETQGALGEGTEVAVEPLPRASKKGEAAKRPTVRRAGEPRRQSQAPPARCGKKS